MTLVQAALRRIEEIRVSTPFMAEPALLALTELLLVRFSEGWSNDLDEMRDQIDELRAALVAFGGTDGQS